MAYATRLAELKTSWGTTAERPANPTSGPANPANAWVHYDTDLDRPVWWSGSQWVDPIAAAFPDTTGN